MNKKCETKPVAKLFVMTASAYYFQHILWANREVLWRIESIFSSLCWLHVLLQQVSCAYRSHRALQRKHPQEQRVRT